MEISPSGIPRQRCGGDAPPQLLYARCAGLDVHTRNVVACVRIVVNHKVMYHRLTVSTTTRGLLELIDWLAGHEVTHVAASYADYVTSV